MVLLCLATYPSREMIACACTMPMLSPSLPVYRLSWPALITATNADGPLRQHSQKPPGYRPVRHRPDGWGTAARVKKLLINDGSAG